MKWGLGTQSVPLALLFSASEQRGSWETRFVLKMYSFSFLLEVGVGTQKTGRREFPRGSAEMNPYYP